MLRFAGEFSPPSAGCSGTGRRFDGPANLNLQPAFPDSFARFRRCLSPPCGSWNRCARGQESGSVASVLPAKCQQCPWAPARPPSGRGPARRFPVQLAPSRSSVAVWRLRSTWLCCLRGQSPSGQRKPAAGTQHPAAAGLDPAEPNGRSGRELQLRRPPDCARHQPPLLQQLQLAPRLGITSRSPGLRSSSLFSSTA